jgi:hypothetical protein
VSEAAGVGNFEKCKGWSWRKIPSNRPRFWGISGFEVKLKDGEAESGVVVTAEDMIVTVEAKRTKQK